MKKHLLLVTGLIILTLLTYSFLSVATNKNDQSNDNVIGYGFIENKLEETLKDKQDNNLGYIYFTKDSQLFEYNINTNTYAKIADRIDINELANLNLWRKQKQLNQKFQLDDISSQVLVSTDNGINVISNANNIETIEKVSLNGKKLFPYGWINSNEFIVNEGIASHDLGEIKLKIYDKVKKSFKDINQMNSDEILNVYGVTPENKYLFYQVKGNQNTYNEIISGGYILFDLENNAPVILNIPDDALIMGVLAQKIQIDFSKNSQVNNTGYFNLPYSFQTQACVTRDGIQEILSTYWGIPQINCSVNNQDADCPYECRDCDLQDNPQSSACIICHENYSNSICHNDKHGDIAVDFSDTKFDNIAMRVLSIGDGILIEKNNSISNSCGRTIRIQHKNGLVTSYCHFSSLNSNIQVGDCISKGQFLGIEGGSGNGQENFYPVHIHIEQNTKDNFASSIGNIYPTYEEHNVSRPRQNLSYVSENTEVDTASNCSFDTTSVEALQCSNTILENISTEGGNYEVVSYSCGSSSLKTGPEKIYSFQAQPGNIEISMINNDISNDLDLFLLDSLDPNLCLAADNSAGSMHNITYNYIGAGLKTFYVVIDSTNGSYGLFDLQLNYNCTPSYTCNDIYEPNDTIPTELYNFGHNYNESLTITTECINQVIADIDWYKFNLVNQGELKIALSSPNISSLFMDWVDSGSSMPSSTNNNGDKEITVCGMNALACFDTALRIYTVTQNGNDPIPYNLDIQWLANVPCVPPPVTEEQSSSSYNQLNTLTLNGNTNVCEGISNTLSASGAGSGMYDWIIDGQSVTIGSTYNTSSLNTGQYDLLVIDTTDACIFVETSLNITSDVTANAGQDVTIQSGTSTTLQGSGGTNCSWSPTTGLTNPNDCVTSASPSQTTTYTLTVSENGCTDTDSVIVTIDNGNTNPPSNDNCSNAIILVSNTSCTYTNGTVENATSSVGANNCSGCSCTSPDDYDVYYKFVAVETSHTVTVSNYASNFDAVIELRTSCSSGSSNYISCYDPSGVPSSVSQTWNNLIIGQTYYIRVFEWDYQGTPPSSSTFDICVTHTSSSSDGIDLISNINNVSNDNPDAGDQITVNYTITNVGDETMTANTTSALYLSTNQTYGSSDALINGSVYALVTNLSPNQSISLSSTVTLPNVSDGQYYIISYPDLPNLVVESDNNNNTDAYPIYIGEIVQNGPDLDVRDVDVIPNSNLIPGQEVDIEVRIENEGTQDVGSFEVLIFFDIDGDNSYDANEYMGEFTFNGLDAGEDDTMTVDFDLPINVFSTGTYEIFAIADSDNTINETNESNNEDDDNVNIGYVYSGSNDDVFVINETVDVTTVNSGDDVFVTCNHVYLGSQSDANVPTLDVGYYLSTDCVFSGDDIFLQDDTSSLGNDDPIHFEDKSLTIPQATQSGTYYILFVADLNNEVNEGTLENNNVECIQITVNGTSTTDGDIFLTDEVCNPINVMIGNEIEPFVNVHYSGNQTNADLPSVALFYYLSNDCVLSTDDILVREGGLDLGSDLPINDTSEEIQLPNNLSPGIYYIIFRADAENVVAETDENNNTACVEFNLFPADATFQDVTLNNPQIELTEVELGGQVYVSVHHNYTGYQTDAQMNSVKMNYYLSTDCALSADDYFFTQETSSLGSDDPSHFEFATLTIPTTILAGDYYILFYADATEIVVENNESNNLECVPITITDSTLSIIDNDLNNIIKVYPNPINDILTIDLIKVYSAISIEILNVTGQKINILEFENEQIINVDTSLLSDGVYFLKIKTDSFESVKFRIIKK